MKRLSLILILISLHGPLVAAGSRVTAVRTAEAIQIDGLLAEASWQAAKPVTLKQKTSRDKSTCDVRLLWDEKYLYLAFDVADQNVETADQEMWNDDSLAISLLDTKGKLHKYRFDIRGSGEGIGHVIAGRMKAGTTLNRAGDQDQGFWVECRIPWQDLGVTPASGVTVPLDLVAVDHDHGPRKPWNARGVKFSKVSLDGDQNVDTCNSTLVLALEAVKAVAGGPEPVEGGQLTRWLVIGPFPCDSIDPDFLGGEAAARPRAGQKAGGREWKICQSAAVLNFEDPEVFDASDDADCYAAAYVWAPAATPARLLTGSDDGIKIWVNGRCVLRDPTPRGLIVDQDRVNMALEKGWNLLLFKVQDYGGQWNLTARLTDRSGRPLAGLKAAYEPTEAVR